MFINQIPSFFSLCQSEVLKPGDIIKISYLHRHIAERIWGGRQVPKNGMSARLLKALFVSILLVKSCFGVSLSDFYPYGANEGDTFLQPNDDGSSGEVEISVRFPYFDRYHDSLYVSIMENTLFYLLVIWWVVWNAACESFVCVMFGGNTTEVVQQCIHKPFVYVNLKYFCDSYFSRQICRAETS